MSVNRSIIYDAAVRQDWTKVMALCVTNKRFASYAGEHDGKTALHIACNECRQPEVFEVLLDAAPESLLIQDNTGMTPLHYACRSRASAEIIGLMIHLKMEQGHAAVSKRDHSGKTPLYYAENFNAHPDVVDMLRLINPDSSAERVGSQEGGARGSDRGIPVPKPVGQRQTSFATAFYRSGSSSAMMDAVLDREIAAAIASSTGYNDTGGSASGSPESWIEDARRQQPAQEQNHQHQQVQNDWEMQQQQWGRAAAAVAASDQQGQSTGGGLGGYGTSNRELLDQYRVMAELEAHRRLEKSTGIDMKELEKAEAIGRVDDGYRKFLLTPRLPEPRRVMSVPTGSLKLQEPTLPPLPRKKESRETKSQIAPEVLPAMLVFRPDEVAQEERELQCLGCQKTLRVNRKAMFATCPSCNAESPAISIRQRVAA